MNVNITLAVQACNFLIASYLLRHFLFKPTISIINEESVRKQTILTIINQQKQSLEIHQKEHQLFWHECKQFFKDNQPIIDNQQSIILEKIKSDIIPHHILAKETDQLVTYVHKTLEEKIKHVH